MALNSHEFLVPFDGSFRVDDYPTAPADPPSKKECRKGLKALIEEFADLQEVLYADDSHSLLLVFQAMDAAGKDSTIRAVTSGVNPAGFQVSSFKAPSANELDHDFLWRTTKALPQRGRIGVFNRSHYEEVLVVRVHPEFLDGQRLPKVTPEIWTERYESINEYEKHLARNGTVIIKFWLNVSQTEQLQRFQSRLERPDKNWKFSKHDLAESALWPSYMTAYQEALNATSRPWSPWYAIPADDKPYMRLRVAEIIVETLKNLDLKYPELAGEQKAELERYETEIKNRLANDGRA